MEEWKDRAIITRLGHFRERDIWLKLLLSDHGLHTVFAFGGASSKRRFCGCLDIYNELDCRITVSRNGGYLNLEEASLCSSPSRLREDWNGMGMAANCLCFVEALGIGAESGEACFNIVRNLRDMLELNRAASWLTPLFFRLKMAAALGFCPDFSVCALCGGSLERGGLFLVDAGRCICDQCVSRLNFTEKRMGVLLDQAALAMLAKIPSQMPMQWQGDKLEGRYARQCGRAIDAFVQYHLGLAWEDGTFRRV